jgi:hypothetical protein
MAAVLFAAWSASAGAQSTDRNTKEIVLSPYLWLSSDGPIVGFTWVF